MAARVTSRALREGRVAINDPNDDDTTDIQDVTDPAETAENVTPYRRRTRTSKTVHHWANYWLGKPEQGNSTWYIWDEQPERIEVAVQQYDEPRWIENLFTDMIDAANEVLEETDKEYTAVRLRVRLFSHRPDGTDARFTLEHIQKRDNVTIIK